MEGLFRRRSGVYFARLVVPARHRAVLGKREFIESTGTRVLAVARIVGGEILARWRRRLHELDGFCAADMNVLQLSAGCPVLNTDGHLPLVLAAEASGINADELLRQASLGKLRLFCLLGRVQGHVIDTQELDTKGGESIVPEPSQMSERAQQSVYSGIVAVRSSSEIANDLLAGEEPDIVLFDLIDQPRLHFAPERALSVSRTIVHLLKAEVEALRKTFATTVTEEQRDAARATAASPPVSAAVGRMRRKVALPLSSAIDSFMKENGDRWAIDQQRRIRSTCDLFVELRGDLTVGEIDRDHLIEYRDKHLPHVPAKENQARKEFGTGTVKETMKAIAETDWPRLSVGERSKRMSWLTMLFTWLHEEGWIPENPALGLGRPRRKSSDKKQRDQDQRDAFDREDLGLIFSASWFMSGKGELTKQGTYREFCPFYYWLPLLGLFTGARINELCQLSLNDIRQSNTGVWFLDINEEGEKKLKTGAAIRLVPIHPFLLQLGFAEWHRALSSAGYRRLFPELIYDPIKGYSKAAVKWFSSYLNALRMPRNGKKVFHSFRHGLATLYKNELRLPREVINQLGGWSRGDTVFDVRYGKDELPDRLIEAVRQVHFDLPPIAAFKVDEGLKALRDAMGRKNKGRGAEED